MVRGGAECKLVEVAGNVQQSCAFTTVPLTAFGWHTTHVDSHSFINAAGATFPTDAVLARMRLDKKNAGGKLRFILPTRLGEVRLFDDVPEEGVAAVLNGE